MRCFKLKPLKYFEESGIYDVDGGAVIDIWSERFSGWFDDTIKVAILNRTPIQVEVVGGIFTLPFEVSHKIRMISEDMIEDEYFIEDRPELFIWLYG